MFQWHCKIKNEFSEVRFELLKLYYPPPKKKPSPADKINFLQVSLIFKNEKFWFGLLKILQASSIISNALTWLKRKKNWTFESKWVESWIIKRFYWQERERERKRFHWWEREKKVSLVRERKRKRFHWQERERERFYWWEREKGFIGEREKGFIGEREKGFIGEREKGFIGEIERKKRFYWQEREKGFIGEREREKGFIGKREKGKFLWLHCYLNLVG